MIFIFISSVTVAAILLRMYLVYAVFLRKKIFESISFIKQTDLIFLRLFFLVTILSFENKIFAQGKDTVAHNSKVEILVDLSIEELMKVEIVTASKTPEKLFDAPATVIVISSDDIKKRGYKDFTEIFSDLPGMDISRPFGDTYMKNYWRGYRNTIGSPYLLMIDGVEFYQLGYIAHEPSVAIPLSNIEKIEVVYGPASSVYGANAHMGVVNVITIKDKDKSGTSGSVTLTKGLKNYTNGDFSFFGKKDDLRVSL